MRLMNVSKMLEGKGVFLNAIRKVMVPGGDNIEKELNQKGKPAEKILLEILKDGCSKIDLERSREAVYDTSLFFLGIYHKDRAYHAQGNYFLYQVAKRADEILKALEWERKSYNFLDPKTWRINIFAEHLERRLRRKK